MSRASEETLAIPKDLRRAVDERDKGFCQMCGKYLGDRRAIHHIYYGGDKQGMGGRRKHTLDNLVSLCWAPGDMDCHARAHSHKRLWQELLSESIATPGVTGLQLYRWRRMFPKRRVVTDAALREGL